MPAKPRPHARPVSYFPLPIRMLLLACFGVVGSAYALVRHYARRPLPMYVGVAADAGDGLEAGEILAPEILVLPDPPPESPDRRP